MLEMLFDLIPRLDPAVNLYKQMRSVTLKTIYLFVA
jgi:hypothetical protein